MNLHDCGKYCIDFLIGVHGCVWWLLLHLHLAGHWPLLCPLTPDGWSVQAQEGQHNWYSPWLCSAHHQRNQWATAGTGDCNARWDTHTEEAALWGKSICQPFNAMPNFYAWYRNACVRHVMCQAVFQLCTRNKTRLCEVTFGFLIHLCIRL